MIYQKDTNFDFHCITIYDGKVVTKPIDIGPSNEMTHQEFKTKFDGYSSYMIIDSRGGNKSFVSELYLP